MAKTYFILSCLLWCSLFFMIESRSSRRRHHESEYKEHKNMLDDSSLQQDDKEFYEPYNSPDPCENIYCGRGRECSVSDQNQAVCVCMDKCKRRIKPVCGSDGQYYVNHCELHRTACVTEKPITIDHSNACLNKDRETTVDPEKKLYTATTEPETILSTPSSMDSSSYSEDDYANDATLASYQDGTTSDQKKCSVQDYEMLKENLLLYNNAKLADGDGEENKDVTQYLVSIMFSHFDQNNNGLLEKEELEQVAANENLDKLSITCKLSDMLKYDDADHDQHLNINEFYNAYSKLYSVSVISLDKALEVNKVMTHVGDNVEIKCDITGNPAPPIVWRRNDVDLSTIVQDEIKVFIDGSLYLTNVQVIHAGNYTCHAQRNRDVVQTHVLQVHTMPRVKVLPKLQYRAPSEMATMMCHVIGEPTPTVRWLKNDDKLKMAKQKYTIVGNGTSLTVAKMTYSDTGAYSCVADNVAGSAADISSIVVEDEPQPTVLAEQRRFFVFHDWGVSVYDGQDCRLYHQIQSTDIIPGTQEYVCGDRPGHNCSWGRAINVADRYVYVSQPLLHRVLIISKIQMVVVDVVSTDKYPVSLHYVSYYDQVWVLCWRNSVNKGSKTIEVIRNASQKRKHHSVHPEPIDGHFDLVNDLFVPPMQDLGHRFKYAYVVHKNQRGMFKIDMGAMKYTKSVDLTPYNCVPKNLVFSSLRGYVIIECEEPVTRRPSGQLLVDYMTDSVLAHKLDLFGKPFISPDSSYVVTLEKRNSTFIITCQKVTEKGLQFQFDVKTTLEISDLTFFPSLTTHSYDIYASSTDKVDVLFIDLSNGKVEMITGVGTPLSPRLTEWQNPNRPIDAGSTFFGTYMVTPAGNALFILNGRTRTVNCEIGNVLHPRIVVWLKVP